LQPDLPWPIAKVHLGVITLHRAPASEASTRPVDKDGGGTGVERYRPEEEVSHVVGCSTMDELLLGHFATPKADTGRPSDGGRRGRAQPGRRRRRWPLHFFRCSSRRRAPIAEFLRLGTRSRRM